MDPDNIIQATISKEDLDTPNEERYKFKASLGLTREIVETISRMKNEPDWMLQKRLHSFDVFMQKDIPKWGLTCRLWTLSRLSTTCGPTPKERKNGKTFLRISRKHLKGSASLLLKERFSGVRVRNTSLMLSI